MSTAFCCLTAVLRTLGLRMRGGNMQPATRNQTRVSATALLTIMAEGAGAGAGAVHLPPWRC